MSNPYKQSLFMIVFINTYAL